VIERCDKIKLMRLNDMLAFKLSICVSCHELSIYSLARMTVEFSSSLYIVETIKIMK